MKAAQDTGLTNLMIIKDYLSIEKYDMYKERLSVLDDLFYIYDKHARGSLSKRNIKKWIPEEHQQNIDRFNLLAKAVKKRFVDCKIWTGYILSSTTKLDLIIYKNSFLEKVLNSSCRKPLSLKGCVTIQILSIGQFSDRKCLHHSGSTRFRHRALGCLGIKVIDIPVLKMDKDKPDPFASFLDEYYNEIDGNLS